MSDELIRKSEVLELIDSLNISNGQVYDDLIFNVEDMPPVNAVELPCKVGDTVYLVELWQFIVEEKVREIDICKENVWVRTNSGHTRNINEVFFTREEAEKALEDLENG